MRSQCSKISDVVAPPVQSSRNSNSNPRYSEDLKLNVDDCRRDPVLRKFDSAVRESTSSAANSVALEEFHSVTLDSLSDVVAPPVQSSRNSNSDPRYSEDLKLYADACRRDPVLRILDSAVRESTSRAVNSVALEEFHSVTLDSLSDVVAPPVQSSRNSNSNPRYSEDLKLDADACRRDPVLRILDSAVRESTSRAVNSVALEEFHSVTLDWLRVITGSLLDMDREFVKIILDRKRDVCKSPGMLSLVDEYFDYNLQISNFCHMLEIYLKRAKDSQLKIDLALRHYENETAQEGFHEKKYKKTLQELKNFKDIGNPFSDEFFLKYQKTTIVKQEETLKKIDSQEPKLDKIKRSMKSWRAVSNVILVSTMSALLIFSVVAAAISAPAVVAALIGALTVPVGSMGSWINSLWKSYETELKGESEVVDWMRVCTRFAIQDLKNIRILVDRLKDEIESLVKNAGLALQEEDAVMIVIDQIKKKLSAFTERLNSLTDQIAKCHLDTVQARTMIFQGIWNSL